MADLLPVVIDLGSYSTKAGYAVPEKDPTVLARSAVLRKDGGPDDEDSFIYPVQRAEIQDWEQVECVLHHTLYDLLKWEFDNEGNVMMVEPMFTSRKDREAMTQLLFERFNCHSYYVAESPIMSLYAANRTTGVCVDVGHGRLDITPVIEGQTVSAAATRLNVGGSDLTARLRSLMGEQLTPAQWKELKHACISVSPTRLDAQRIGGAATVHTLPDGKQISVGNEGEWAGEALMQPGLMGEGTGGDLSDAVYGAAMACQEFYARRMMLESVLLCGGGSGVQGLGKRLETELHELVPPSTKPEVVMAPDYLPASTLKHAAWCGAAVLAKVVFPQQQNITKFEYNECGPSIVHRKC